MTVGNWRLLALGASIIGGFTAGGASALEIRVVSSSPQLVSGNEALLELTGVNEPPRVTLNGRDARVEFKPKAADPTKQLGLVANIRLGKNDLTISSGRDSASITLFGHDPNATLFAGPQDAPFLCELEAHGLKPSVTSRLDPWRAECTAATQVSYFYRDTKGAWKPFNAAARPTDIAMGAKGQPMIIRQEIGVLNRAAYVISIPHDPGAGPAPTPIDRGTSAWNGKLMYSFGPGARADGHHQGRSKGQLSEATRWVGDANGTDYWYIDNGYAVAAASLNSFGTSTDAIVSAETAYKVKERFIEQFGEPIFTVGNGVSGGSMQQHLIANAYPGLLDGIVPSNSYADGMTFLQPMFDCELLVNVFKQGTWTRPQMEAVSGKYWGYCVSNAARYPNKRADNCDAVVLEMPGKYPSVRAEDVRCTFQDDLLQVFGDDPKTGFARSPWDNVGVQYGLKALNDGAITFAQFIDINMRIGGHDINGKLVPQRSVGDPDALRAAYATGQMNLMNGGLASIPIVSTRYNLDADPYNRGDANVDVHDRYHSEIVKARLEKYNGNSRNYVQMLAATVGPGGGPNRSLEGTPFRQGATEVVAALDAWMTAIANDKSSRPAAEKVAAHRPKELVDACWAVDGKAFADWTPNNAVRGKVEKITDWNRCNQIFPMFSDPRIAAGGPITSDVLKCQLKPIDAKDYKVAPTAAQLAQLKTAFPEGVCDWSKPGVGQDTKLTAWAVFKDVGEWAALR